MDNPERNHNFESSQKADEQQPAEGVSLSSQANLVHSNDEDLEPETSLVAEHRISVQLRTINRDASQDGEQDLFCNNGAVSVFIAETNQTESGRASNNRKTSTATPLPNLTADVLVENGVSRSYSTNLPSLPDSSMEDGAKPNYGKRSECLVTGRSREKEIPRENVCERSFQVPSYGVMAIKIFLMEETCPERNKKTFLLYLIPGENCKVYEEICLEFKNGEALSRQIPLTVKGGTRSEDFYTLYCDVHQAIKVGFEIENTIQGNVVPLNQGHESVFRVPGIISESENRLAKGSKCQFVVQYVGEPGEACQEQGIATITIDSNNHTTLFFPISFWCSQRTDQP